MENEVLHEPGFGARNLFIIALSGVISGIAFYVVDCFLFMFSLERAESVLPVIFFAVCACLAALAVWLRKRRAKYRDVAAGLFCGWISAAVVIVGVLHAHPPREHNACINNLRLIDSAKQQWALEQRKQNSDTPAGSDLQLYLGRGSAGELPICEMDTNNPPSFATSYSINNVGTKPTCKICPTIHILP